MKKILLIAISLISFHLNAMVPVGEPQLSDVIERIEQGDLHNQATQQDVINDLVTIAMRNPGNLVARGYLWAILKAEKNLLAISPSRPLVGMKQILVQEYENAPSFLTDFIHANFLNPSAIISSIVKHEANHRKFVQNAKKYEYSKDEKKRVVQYCDESENFRRKKLEQGVAALLESFVKDHSLRAFTFLNLRYPHHVLGSLHKFAASVLTEEERKTFLAELSHNVLETSYLGNTKAMTDGALEYLIARKVKDFKTVFTMTVVAVVLGHDGALEGYFSQSIFFDFTTEKASESRKSLAYAAKLLPSPERLLLSAVANLSYEETGPKAIEDLEYFLVMPEASVTSCSVLVRSALDAQNYQYFTPHALAQKYLEEKKYAEARRVFIRSWQKGFVPNTMLRHQIADHLFSDDEKEQTNNLLQLCDEIIGADLEPSAVKDVFLANLYFAANDLDNARHYINECLSKFAMPQQDNVLELFEAHLSLASVMSLFRYDKRLWADHEKLRVHGELFLAVQPYLYKTFGGDFHILGFLIFMELNDNQRAGHCLNEAAKAGDEIAKVLLIPRIIFQSLDATSLSSSDEQELELNTNEATECSINTQEGEEKKRCSDLIVPVGKGEENENEKTDSKKLVIKPNLKPQLLTKRESAIKNIKAFIGKWEDSYWKCSDRNELINDFRKMVLLNENVDEVNSNYVHGNHGRRNTKYGSRASSFEIETLVMRARKILKKLYL